LLARFFTTDGHWFLRDSVVILRATDPQHLRRAIEISRH
jgi:hypothetical protein